MFTIPEKMTCIEIREPGGPEVLQSTYRPVPQPDDGEVLIEVKAAGVNRPDCIQRQGYYAPPAGVTDIPGLEVAGKIITLGKGVKKLMLGEQVCALVAGGGYAQYVVAPEVQCLPIPKKISMIEAATLPETYFTVWFNLFERAELKSGESILIHGGSSGIGTTAIQICSLLGARVLATASTKEKCKACSDLGAERTVNYKEEDFVVAANEFTSGDGLDVVLDMVGGEYIQRNIKALGMDGRHVSIAFLGGAKANINFMPVMLKRLTLTGSTLRPLPIKTKGEIADALKKVIWPFIEKGEIVPVVHSTFSLKQATEAHSLMESNQHIGKITLVP
jgi:putative PIG3 family NAD(P)H quinone oxidoreductase